MIPENCVGSTVNRTSHTHATGTSKCWPSRHFALRSFPPVGSFGKFWEARRADFPSDATTNREPLVRPRITLRRFPPMGNFRESPRAAANRYPIVKEPALAGACSADVQRPHLLSALRRGIARRAAREDESV